MRLSFPYTTICLSYHVCPIRPCGAPSPRGEGYDTRIPSSKKAALPPCESAPPYRHPERSRGIFIALPPYAHMRPHSNDTLVLPFSPFPRSRFTALQEGALYFGPHDTQERRIVLYRFSYRCVELCLFEALYPAPSARSFYILMHCHRPTHCPHKTHRTRFPSFIQSRGPHRPRG